MYNFINFIKKTDHYSNNDFFQKNNYTLNQLNEQKIYKCKTEKPKIDFEQKGYNEIYNHSPGFPSIKTILKNKDNIYIIPGGIRSVGARYPDYLVSKKDIMYLKQIMTKRGIMKIPISNFKKVLKECIVLCQDKLKTNYFNNLKKTRWSVFDTMVNNFRDLCLGISNYSRYKNKLVPTNLAMLMFFTGDCREHCLLLAYLVNIYLHYNDKEGIYYCLPIYTDGGHGEVVNKKVKFIDDDNKIKYYSENDEKFVNEYYQHTFPIIINKQKKTIMTIDALHHKTKIVPQPRRENTFFHIKYINKHKGTNYYKVGYSRKNKASYLIKLVDWYANVSCEYMKYNKFMKNKFFLYGIPFIKPNMKYVFDKDFNDTILNDLLRNRLCNPH